MHVKLCNECCSNRPVEAFGLNKLGRLGRNNTCMECRAQGFRLRRKRLYQAKSAIDDTIIRRVFDQNSHIIDLGLAQFHMDAVAFSVPANHTDYKVIFGDSDRSGMRSVAVFDMEGRMYRELSYSGQTQDIKNELLRFFKSLGLRLELSASDAYVSKAQIYYL